MIGVGVGKVAVEDVGARCWNGIPIDIKSSPSVGSFHRKLKAFFFENSYKL